jgi:glutamyl-Q tRNA(Asp) synthetase
VREVPGSVESILEALHAFGFRWDQTPVRQSARTALYDQALERLRVLGLAYPCSCSRAEIQAASPAATGEELRYPGWCRNGVRASDRDIAWRFRVPDEPVSFTDAIQGQVTINVAADVGDFVVRRRDGLFAYQLAVVVDDADQGITHVVRGADLLTSTPRQLLLQKALGLPNPAYAHVPVATDDKGVKLSKSAGAGSVDLQQPRQELWRALRFLRQEPPAVLRRASLDALWAWAIEHWRLDAPGNVRARPLDTPDPPA